MEEKKGLSIASLICGIAGSVLCCVPYLPIFVGIVAVILGALGKKKGGKGMAIAGLVLGILAIIFGILYSLGLAAFISNLKSSIM